MALKTPNKILAAMLSVVGFVGCAKSSDTASNSLLSASSGVNSLSTAAVLMKSVNSQTTQSLNMNLDSVSLNGVDSKGNAIKIDASSNMGTVSLNSLGNAISSVLSSTKVQNGTKIKEIEIVYRGDGHGKCDKSGKHTFCTSRDGEAHSVKIEIPQDLEIKSGLSYGIKLKMDTDRSYDDDDHGHCNLHPEISVESIDGRLSDCDGKSWDDDNGEENEHGDDQEESEHHHRCDKLPVVVTPAPAPAPTPAPVVVTPAPAPAPTPAPVVVTPAPAPAPTPAPVVVTPAPAPAPTPAPVVVTPAPAPAPTPAPVVVTPAPAPAPTPAPVVVTPAPAPAPTPAPVVVTPAPAPAPVLTPTDGVPTIFVP